MDTVKEQRAARERRTAAFQVLDKFDKSQNNNIYADAGSAKKSPFNGFPRLN